MKFSAVPDHVLTSRYLKKDIRAWAVDLPNFIDHAMADPERMKSILGPDVLSQHAQDLLAEANNQNGILAVKNAWNLFLHNPLWDIREDVLDDYLGCHNSISKRTEMMVDVLAGKPDTSGTGSPSTLFLSQLDKAPGLGANLLIFTTVERIIEESWSRDNNQSKTWLDVTSRSLDNYGQREIEIIRDSEMIKTWMMAIYRGKESEYLETFCVTEDVLSSALCASIAHGGRPIPFNLFCDGFRRSKSL